MPLTWLYIFVFFVCVDFALTFLAKRYSLAVNNAYYQINLKYGYFKVSLLKVALALFLGWSITEPAFIARMLVGIIFYCLLIVKLFIDFLQSISKKRI